MIYLLRSVTAMIVAAGAVLTGTAGHGAQGRLTCPGTVQVGQQLPTDISVNVGSTPLGAYSVTVTYDPAVLTIASVAGGSSPEFSGSPTTNSGSFTSGSTNISAFQTTSLTGPTGIVSIARPTFNAVGPAASTTVGLTVRSLFDTNSNPISVTATGCVVAVTGGGTTTSSTSSTTTTRPTTTTSTTHAPTTTTTTTRPSTSTTSTTTVPTTTSLPTTTSTSTTTSSSTTIHPTTTSTSTTTTTTLAGNRSPDCSAAVATPASLSPPNHRFVKVSVTGVTDPDGDPVAISITSITQNEALNAMGDRNTCPDATGVGTATASLRAEREGSGDGRVYHIGFTADDDRGGRCAGTVTVCVPQGQAGQPCVDEGPSVDSTGPIYMGACTAGCAIEMALAQPLCAGEDAPPALVQRVDSAQQLIAQAAAASGKKNTKGLMRRGIRVAKQAVGTATEAAKKGTISQRCAASIAKEFGNVRAAADGWLRTR